MCRRTWMHESKREGTNIDISKSYNGCYAPEMSIYRYRYLLCLYIITQWPWNMHELHVQSQCIRNKRVFAMAFFSYTIFTFFNHYSMIFNQVVSRAASKISFFPTTYSRWGCGKSRMSEFTVLAKQYLLLPARFWSWLIILGIYNNCAECIIDLFCILKNVFHSQWFSTCLATKHNTTLVYNTKANMSKHLLPWTA